MAVAEEGERGAAALVDGQLRNEDLDGVRVLLVLDVAVPLGIIGRDKWGKMKWGDIQYSEVNQMAVVGAYTRPVKLPSWMRPAAIAAPGPLRAVARFVAR